MKKLNILDPLSYIQDSSSFESDVIRFERNNDYIVLVISYAWEFEIWSQGYWEFRKLTFNKISNFKQTQLRHFGAFDVIYQASAKHRTYAVSQEEIKLVNGSYYANYCFSDLGCFEFCFELFHVDIKPVHVKREDDGSYAYVDEDNMKINEYDPFKLK